MHPIRAYAAWTRRQAGTVNCFHFAAAVSAGVLALALLCYVCWDRIWPVLMVAGAVVLACGIAAALIVTALPGGPAALRPARRPAPAPRPVPLCEDCGAAVAVAEVTYANGRRRGTVRTCAPCWTAAEDAATGPLPAWTQDCAPEPAAPGEAPAVPPRDAVPGSDETLRAQAEAVLGGWTRGHP